MLKKRNPITLTCVAFSDEKLVVSIAKARYFLFDQSWSIMVNREGVFTFPEDLLEKLDWQIGDEVDWVNQDNGTFTLTKTNKNTNGSKKKKITPSNRASRRKA